MKTDLDRLVAVAALGEQMLETVKASGLLRKKPGRRKGMKRKVVAATEPKRRKGAGRKALKQAAKRANGADHVTA